MDCPRCKGSEKRKDGIVRVLQRYMCRGCGYRYTVERRTGTASIETKRKALQLYLEGLGLRSIGRVLGVSNVSVLRWVRTYGEQVMALKKDHNPVEIMELDELHSYVKSKKTPVGYGLLLIDIKKGSSMLCWALEETKQVKSSGSVSNTRRLDMS
jgi:transposase